MKGLPQISEAEYEVMKVIWRDAPVSTNEVTDKLTRTTAWSPKTIQTMLKRLVSKARIRLLSACRGRRICQPEEQLFPQPLLWRRPHFNGLCLS